MGARTPLSPWGGEGNLARPILPRISDVRAFAKQGRATLRGAGTFQVCCAKTWKVLPLIRR